MECATRILIHIMGQQDLIMLLARTTLSSVSEEEEGMSKHQTHLRYD